MGIPFDSGTAVNCIRTDYLEQAGFTVEDFTDITWSDYMEKAKIVKEKTGQPMLTAKSATPDIIMMMLQSCGASLFQEDGRPNLDQNDVLKECMSIYIQMVRDNTLEEMPGWDQYIASINNGTDVYKRQGPYRRCGPSISGRSLSEGSRAPVREAAPVPGTPPLFPHRA